MDGKLALKRVTWKCGTKQLILNPNSQSQCNKNRSSPFYATFQYLKNILKASKRSFMKFFETM